MVAACVEPLPLYRPRDPQASDLWRLLDQHFETFQQVYDERFAAKYGFWRPVVERSVTAFLKCGDLYQGFARVRCPDCQHEMFVAFSCKQRCTCPSCHQKRALLTAIHVAEEACAPVAHRQVVLTIPKRLRLHTRFHREPLGQLCTCVWTCIQAEVRVLLGRDDVVPGSDPDVRRTPALSEGAGLDGQTGQRVLSQYRPLPRLCFPQSQKSVPQQQTDADRHTCDPQPPHDPARPGPRDLLVHFC